ncbi:DUF3455 domain-containing protein [Chitinimonas sp. PSY-7]|uniref:DUF3455 domain-containing protein n=1 Tax=Chitinimonas sp. PSY-7 TaxID=3459088 RepID=UPI00403FEF0D
MSKAYLPLVVVIPAILAACATTPPKVPAALNPPAGQVLTLEALAGEGVQIYECSQKADGTYEWAFKFPEAKLLSRTRKSLGKHYAGPTWEAPDGSTIVAQLAAKDPGPNASAIPWLLLSAKANTGSGVFARTKSIQRVDTVGGIAPSEACNAGSLKKVVRVPYTATYYFYE